MAKTNKIGLGLVLIQVALAILFIVTGLALLNVGGFGGGEEISGSIGKLFNGTLADIVRLAIGIVVLACGALLVIRFFWNPGKLDNLFKLITLIIWIVVALMAHVLGGFNLMGLASDLLVIGGLLAIRD